jgi:hypothetical protein
MALSSQYELFTEIAIREQDIKIRCNLSQFPHKKMRLVQSIVNRRDTVPVYVPGGLQTS